MRLSLILICIVVLYFDSYSQKIQLNDHKNIADPNSYAIISAEGKGLGKKLKVDVDLGDTPEQIKAGKEYSEILTNKKSYAAVLNYMAENDFELVESRDINFSYQGTGGTAGIIFIMRKKPPSFNNK